MVKHAGADHRQSVRLAKRRRAQRGCGGERLEGQSPRGLDPLESRVRAGLLEVRFQRFAFGTSERRPVE